MLAMVAESALRSLVLGSAVWVGLILFRVRSPHLQMSCWAMVLMASLAMPLLMHWTTVSLPMDPVLEAPVHLWPTAMAPDALPETPALPGATAREIGRAHV